MAYYSKSAADYVPLIGYHDACAEAAFKVDKSTPGWGSWHHGKGLYWANWLAGVKCEACGKDC